MANNYKALYRVAKNKDTQKFEVIEIQSENIMFVSDTYEGAQKRYRELKKPKGFMGWTPSFFLKTIKWKEKNANVA